MKVAVLMGGWSAEREVSLTSGRGIAQACRSLGHDVTEIDMGRDVAQRLNISMKTVEAHRANIKQKLGLSSSQELVRYAVCWVEEGDRASGKLASAG